MTFCVFPAYSEHTRWIKSSIRDRLKHRRKRTKDVVPYMRGKCIFLHNSLGVAGSAWWVSNSVPPCHPGILTASPAMFPTWLHLWVPGGRVLQFSPFLSLDERKTWSRGQPGFFKSETETLNASLPLAFQWLKLSFWPYFAAKDVGICSR